MSRPKKQTAAPTSYAPNSFKSLAEVGASLKLHVRAVAEEAIRQGFKLFVRGDGWHVAWGCVASNGVVVTSGDQTETWTGVGEIAPQPIGEDLTNGPLVVADIVNDARTTNPRGTFVAWTEHKNPPGPTGLAEFVTTLSPTGRQVAIEKMLLREEDAVRLGRSLSDDAESMNFQKKYETALRLLAIAVHWAASLDKAHAGKALLRGTNRGPKKLALNKEGLANALDQHLTSNLALSRRGISKRNVMAYLTEAEKQFNAAERVAAGDFDE